ncbi:MAG: BCCT family transporter, partial [bacterium]
LFGLATSLGFGVQQVSAGLDHVFGLNDSVRLQVILIIIITLGATGSVVSGLDKGVKRLSTLNIYIAAIFLVFMLVLGPTLFILDTYVQNIGTYFQSLLAQSFWTESYQQSDWQNTWTVFYWSWWISWSPFVGMFIARISKGRTIQEFVSGVLIVPTLLTFLWLSAFGGSALFLEMNNIGSSIADAVNENVATALYQLLEHFPFSAITSVVAIILVTSFFVTSSDSGSLVVDAFTSGGKLDSPVGQRIFWAGTEGAIAAVLLIGGGLGALQTASIMTGLPFTIILIIMCFSLYRGLQKEHLTESKAQERITLESYKRLIGKAIERENIKKKDKNER